jgi:DNA invertase Pin-like site-specific DNA recombinase
MASPGYTRVSTNQQKRDIQIRALTAHGIPKDRIYKDKALVRIPSEMAFRDSCGEVTLVMRYFAPG